VFAIEMAASRAGVPLPTLSAAWLHLSTGDARPEGRDLTTLIERAERDLPCAEEVLPYAELEEGRVSTFADLDEEARTNSRSITEEFGIPECIRVPPDDIAMMKTLLAAGWVMLLATTVDEHFQRDAPMALGLPLLPLPGARRIGGHAWCVLGYEHTDGALNWKYQGHFVALNSWGLLAHHESPYGPGTISLPFSYVWQHALEAFALRFPVER
jgi:hypothetical protein